MSGPPNCYDLSGSVLTDSPCTNGTVSHCCIPGWTCLPNKICQSPSYETLQYARSSCTDKTFQDPACPQFCQKNATNDLFLEPGFSEIYNAGNGTGCCLGPSKNCSTLPGSPDALDFGATNIADSKSVVYLRASSTSASQSATATANGGPLPGKSTVPGGSSTPVFIAAIILGSLLFVAIVVIGGWCLIRQRQRIRQRRELAAQKTGGPWARVPSQMSEKVPAIVASRTSAPRVWELRNDAESVRELDGENWRRELHESFAGELE